MPKCNAATEALFAKIGLFWIQTELRLATGVCYKLPCDILALQIVPQDCFSSKRACKPAWVYGCKLQLARVQKDKNDEPGETV